MNALDIEKILNELKVSNNGKIRGKNKANNKLHSLHLKEVENLKNFIRSLNGIHNIPELVKDEAKQVLNPK